LLELYENVRGVTKCEHLSRCKVRVCSCLEVNELPVDFGAVGEQQLKPCSHSEAKEQACLSGGQCFTIQVSHDSRATLCRLAAHTDSTVFNVDHPD